MFWALLGCKSKKFDLVHQTSYTFTILVSSKLYIYWTYFKVTFNCKFKIWRFWVCPILWVLISVLSQQVDGWIFGSDEGLLMVICFENIIVLVWYTMRQWCLVELFTSWKNNFNPMSQLHFGKVTKCSWNVGNLHQGMMKMMKTMY